MLIRWWKQRLSDHLVGLDISPDSIKLLRINSAEQPFEVENFAITTLPSGLIVKDEIKDYPFLITVLKDLFSDAGTHVKNVAFAIPRSAVIIKNTTIDGRLNAAEVDSRIWIEANRHFPDLVGEIYLDYNLIGPSQDDPKLMDYMLVACRKDQIKPYMELIRQSGLNAKVADVNCYAFERALGNMLLKNHDMNTVALLNLDLNISSLILSENRKLVFAHDQTFDGHRLMSQVQEYLKSDVEAADPSVQKGSEQDTIYFSMLKDNLSVHLRHSMHFFYSSRPHIVIQKILLSGDLASLPNFAQFIQKEVGIETEIANPFANMTFGHSVDEKLIQKYAPTLMECCGIALCSSKRSSGYKTIEELHRDEVKAP